MYSIIWALILLLVSACSSNTTERVDDSSIDGSVGDIGDHESSQPNDGQSTDSDEGGSGTITGSGGSCLGLPVVNEGLKLEYQVIQQYEGQFQLTLEAVQVDDEQIRFLVTENEVSYEARLISICRELSEEERQSLSTITSNLNAFSGNEILDQILNQSPLGLRSIHSSASSSTGLSCGVFIDYVYRDEIGFMAESCNIEYNFINEENRNTDTSTILSNFNILDTLWIVEQYHVNEDGLPDLSILLTNIQAESALGSINTF